jgi:hypothetical protein
MDIFAKRNPMSVVRALTNKLFQSLSEHQFLTTLNLEDGEQLEHALLTEAELTMLCEAAFDMGVRSGMAAMQKVRSGTYQKADADVINLITKKCERSER